ncbi:MAG: hypothetical protein M1830_000642 [Pleopsidium flavum]|nr:MAG: hypothetical protein M1830_000642 [Pleopsidium flavum]
MPSILSDDDKETVRRTVPKAANKIHAVAVARLYIAYTNKQRWTYTGLQGAVVLANDLVGNTFWIKLVDISSSNRGVIWDQEIYDIFSYNQDRTFFHSFELENCLAGLSFVDEKEAKQFKKKMDEREKNASKSTKATSFGSGGGPVVGNVANGKSHGLLGGIGNLLHGHRSSSAPSIHMQQSNIPAREPVPPASPSPNRSRGSSLEIVDPSWRGLLDELLQMGITEDQIEQNSEFIKSYIEQKQASDSSNGLAGSGAGGGNDRRGKAPPPPPPPSAPPGRHNAISPQHTGSITASRRGPPPAPPPSRKSRPDNFTTPSPSSQHESPPESPAQEPSPPRGPPPPRFRAPPPLAEAGKFANINNPVPLSQPRAASTVAYPGPPPPPRPPKTPMDEPVDLRPKFGVAPPFQGDRLRSATPPPPPSRGPVPPAPPSRDTSNIHPVPPSSAAPPPLPPKSPNAPAPYSGPPPPLPMPNRNISPAATTPSLLPALPRPIPTAPSSFGGHPPPPPPPMPSANGPPPPPLPPGRNSTSVPQLPGPTGGKEDVLASIRASGGIGGGRLKKVSETERRDRSSALVPGAMDGESGRQGTSPTPTGGAEGGLAGALAAALSKRKAKVSASDDEDDDDDWDETPKRK